MAPNGSGLNGRLDELQFADILRLLQSSKQEGALHLHDESSIVVVVAPDVVCLAAGETDDGLRQAVVGAGLVDSGTWDRIAGETAGSVEPGTAIELLVAAGAHRDRLRARIYEHSVTTLFELLLPSEANFSFNPGESHPFAVLPGYPFDDVLTDVRHLVHEWREIAAAIPSTSLVLQIARRLPMACGPITLTPEEFELLALVDGHRDVSTLIQDAGMSVRRVMTQLHRLMSLGAVEPVSSTT